MIEIALPSFVHQGPVVLHHMILTDDRMQEIEALATQGLIDGAHLLICTNCKQHFCRTFGRTTMEFFVEPDDKTDCWCGKALPIEFEGWK